MKVHISKEAIETKIQELAKEISKDYENQELLLCGILNGAFIFLADLSRAISIPHKIDFMGASSYADAMVSSGNVKITKYPDTNPAGKHVLIVEDVIETGLTLQKIKSYLKEEGALSVKVCSLIIKQINHDKKYSAEYVGFLEGDEFLVGYGMDYGGLYRNLPYIGVIE